jgi:hypothetical protein
MKYHIFVLAFNYAITSGGSYLQKSDTASVSLGFTLEAKKRGSKISESIVQIALISLLH